MRILPVVLVLTLVAATQLSCDPEEVPAYVEATMIRSGYDGSEFMPRGDLDTKGADWYGYCATDDGKFKFEVGHNDVSHVSSAGDFNLLIKGIEGPGDGAPTEGIWQDPTTKAIKNDPALRGTFSNARFKNVNQWIFEPEDASDGVEDCYVQLYGVPAEGELTPNQQAFSHFVKIVCFGLDDVEDSDGNGLTLNALEVEIYFNDC